MIEGPIVKLEIQSMRASIMHHIGVLFAQQQAEIEAQLQQIVDGFDFRAAVEREAIASMEVQIREAVKRAVSRAFLSDDVQAILDRLAVEQIKHVLERITAGG